MVKERIRKRVVVAQVEALSPEFDFRDWWKPRKIWLWTACLRLWTRGFLNMERHVRLAAGCLNSYEHILKTAKWNLRLGGTTQSTHVDSYFHTKRRTKGRFCFSQIYDELPVPIFFFVNVRHKYVTKSPSVWPGPLDSNYFTPSVCLCANPVSPGAVKDGWTDTSWLLSDPLSFADMDRSGGVQQTPRRDKELGYKRR